MSTRRFGMPAAAGLILFVGLQFARPDLPNPPVRAELQAPPEVKAILRNSCYSCHSNETSLPWFDKIVPAYWMVARDVKQAREHLNFSEIGAKPAALQKAALFEAVNQIQFGAMPLPSYALVHHGAVVTPEQLATLRSYLSSAATPRAGSPPTQATAGPPNPVSQPMSAQENVATAPNGIQFPADYKNWRMVSTSDRFDNHTVRAILGNDIAIKAIAAHTINPWPDGTIFAKVAWEQQADAAGVAHAGKFIQVEFMIRDSKKYASTAGWGWARWRGSDLKPYGADAHFSSECISCHTPVSKNDFVFTEPIEGGVRQ